MAIYFFEDITAAQALSYTSSDVLVFTTPGLTASQVSVTFVPFTATTPDYIILGAPVQGGAVQRSGRLPQ